MRYGFRQRTATSALLKAFGKNRKAAFMTPDYTYGHTVTKSVNDYLAKNGGWTMVTNNSRSARSFRPNTSPTSLIPAPSS